MDSDFFAAAEKKLKLCTQKVRPKLLAAHGNVAFVDKPNNEGPVTELDKRVEELIIQELKSLDSTIGIFAEESGQEGSKTTYWAIDPIDGTKAFIRGLPFCSNMVALVDRGEVKYSFVYQFIINKLYTAQLGRGAFLNGVQVKVKQRPLEQIWLISHAGLKNYGPLLLKLSKQIERVVIGSNIMAVADGAIDAYMSVPDGSRGNTWDYAPRALIYKEAGAAIMNIDSDSYNPKVRTLLAAHPSVVDELQQIILSATS